MAEYTYGAFKPNPSPFKVVQLNFLSQKLQEFYKGRTLFAVSKQLFLWSLWAVKKKKKKQQLINIQAQRTKWFQQLEVRRGGDLYGTVFSAW